MTSVFAESIDSAKSITSALSDLGYDVNRTGKWVEVYGPLSTDSLRKMIKEWGFEVRKLKLDDGKYYLIIS